MSSFSMITSGGLVSITEASSHGLLIDVRYFLPVYDWRIDPFISPTDDTFINDDISTVTSPQDTSPSGEIIWNVGSDDYSLSESDKIYLISGSDTQLQNGVDFDLVINSKQLQHQSINLCNSIPLSDHIYSEELLCAPSASNTVWQLVDASVVAGLNVRPTGTISDFWNVVEYASIIGEDGRSRAAFKCRINKSVGNFKFNKIALYAVKLDEDYKPFGEPFLFAQSILPHPEIKSNLNDSGLSEILIDVQLELTTSEIEWDDVVYGSQNDYWQKITEDGSLHHSKGVYIGKFAPKDNNTRLGKVVISTWENLGYGEDYDFEELNKPQLVIQNVTDGQNKVGHFSTFKVDSDGNLNFCLSADDGFYSYHQFYEYDSDFCGGTLPKNQMFVPEYDGRFFFGSQEKRWKGLFLGTSGYGLEYAGNTDEYNDPKHDKLAIDIHGGGIQIGKGPDSQNQERSDMTYAIRLIDRSIKFENRFFKNSHILGADIKKDKDESLMIYTVKPNTDYTTSSFPNSDIYLIAGNLEDKYIQNYGLSGCNSSFLYQTIKLFEDGVNNISLFDSKSQMYLLANGGINLLSNVRGFANNIGSNGNYFIFNSLDFNNNGKQTTFVLMSGIKESANISKIISSSENNNYKDVLDQNSVLEIGAGKQIRFWGDIIPVESANDSTNSFTVSPKSVSYSRQGFKLGKILDLISCNAAIDNVRFFSYYEQPFARYQSLNLNSNFEPGLIIGSNIKPAIGANNGKISDIFRFAKWARIGNMILLKFYLNLQFDVLSNTNTKLTFKIPNYELQDLDQTNNEIFEGSNNYLTLEVEGTNATQYTEQSNAVEVAGSTSPKIYYPVELMFSKDFKTFTDPTETEKKVLVPAYAQLNNLGEPIINNQYGSMPYSNPFATYSIRFYIRKGSFQINLDPLKEYIQLSDAFSGNVALFNGVKNIVDYLINAQAKNDSDRTDEEKYSLSQFPFKFYSWNSFTQMLKDNGINLTENDSLGGKHGVNNRTRLEYSSSIFRRDTTYPGGVNLKDGGWIYLNTFTDNFKNIIRNNKASIIRIDVKDFVKGAKSEIVYLRLMYSSAYPDPFIEIKSSGGALNEKDLLNRIANTKVNHAISMYAPMLKVLDFKTGVKKRITYGCIGHAWDPNDSQYSYYVYNSNEWQFDD